jgi:hypothetical protein
MAEPKDRSYRSFEEAREFARSLNLKGRSEWVEFMRGTRPEVKEPPQDIPMKPDRVYADKGWAGWGDFLGTDNVPSYLKQFVDFDEARSFARGLMLGSLNQWRDFSAGRLPQKGTRPPAIPAKPDKTYATKGWAGWRDWLGSDLGEKPTAGSRPDSLD